MAIIYSYPRTSNIDGKELLICSKKITEGDTTRVVNYNISTYDLASYVQSNIPNPTLDAVLGYGNVSTRNATINNLILNGSLTFGYSLPGTFEIKKPLSTSGTNLVATFQKTTGTVAYLSDIPSNTNYGLFTQTVNSVEIVENNSERTLIGTGLGSLSIPADNFKVGDSFRATLMGHISSLNNAKLRIRVKAFNGSVYALLADTESITLVSSEDQHWKLEIDFTIRAIGSFGDASIVGGGSFYYNKGNGNIDLKTFVTENNTSFDTESINTLFITAQFDNASISNSIYSNLFTLTKTY